MWSAAHAKRWVFLVHRWTGVAACVLMALWVFSGAVMLFVGYPKLLPSERLRALPSLASAECCVPVEDALRHTRSPATVQQITLTTIAGRPSYRIKEGDGTLRVIDAGTGMVASPVDGSVALRSARAFLPGASGMLQGRIEDDRWTHSGLLDAHRPLFKVQMNDPAASLLYVSSSTGEVVMDVPRAQRYWNYVGAWLHWIYMFRDGSRDPVWSWLVIALSAVGTVSAIAGAFVGIWRWRFAGRYKTGARTPYREFQMRWHHITGLVFGAAMVLWIFSGLMSMNPWRILSSNATPLRIEAMHGGSLVVSELDAAPQTLLQAMGRPVSELRWHHRLGRNIVTVYSAAGMPVVLDSRTAQSYVPEPQALMAASRRLLPYPVKAVSLLDHYDFYYYARDEHSMTGGGSKPLPVMRVIFDDPAASWVHIDPQTGAVLGNTDRHRRASRWLFAMLHSWDWLPWLERRPLWDVLLIVLSLGGAMLSITGVVIGWRRLGRKLGRAHRRS